MAKKENVNNVVINTEELKPTTIGYLNNKQKGPFLLLIVFGVLFATIFFMSQLTNIFNMIFNPELYTEMKDAQRSSELDSTGVIEELNSGTTLNVAGVKFNSFSIKDGQLNFNVNATNSSRDFSNYYIETYDRGKALLERVLIASTSISSVKLYYTNVKFISINHYDANSYPSINLTNSTLTCTKDDDTYQYEFISGGASKVAYIVSMKLTDSNIDAYNTALNKYMEESGKTSSNGVTQKLQSDEQEFTYTKEVDLRIASGSQLSYGYPYNSKPEQIAFEMSTKGFRCK